MAQVDQETIDLLVSQIKSIEAQLAGLRMKVQKLGEPPRAHTFGDLRGILAGVADTTEEEIDAALYRFDWQEDEGSA
jgi:hypothetical protein